MSTQTDHFPSNEDQQLTTQPRAKANLIVTALNLSTTFDYHNKTLIKCAPFRFLMADRSCFTSASHCVQISSSGTPSSSATLSRSLVKKSVYGAFLSASGRQWVKWRASQTRQGATNAFHGLHNKWKRSTHFGTTEDLLGRLSSP